MVDNADDMILMQKILSHLHRDQNMNHHQLKHEKKEICDKANSESNSNHDCCTMHELNLCMILFVFILLLYSFHQQVMSIDIIIQTIIKYVSVLHQCSYI